MLNEDALEYYNIDKYELNELIMFCEKYISNCDIDIVDLMYYDGKLIKVNNEVKQLLEDHIIKINTNFIDVVYSFSVKDIYTLIPNIKSIFENINIPFTKRSIKSDELKTLIVDNKKTFYEYFKDYAIISVSKKTENYIEKYEEYIEEYHTALNIPNESIEDKKHKEYRYSYETYNKPVEKEETPLEEENKTNSEYIKLAIGVIVILIILILIF